MNLARFYQLKSILYLVLAFTYTASATAADNRGLTGSASNTVLSVPGLHFCSRLLENYKLERIREDHGDLAAFVYKETVLSPQGFHPSESVRKKAYTIFKNAEAHTESIAFIAQMLPEKLRLVITHLELLPAETQRDLLQNPTNLLEWIKLIVGNDEIDTFDLNPEIHRPFKDSFVEKEIYKKARTIQNQLKKQGVNTSLHPFYHPLFDRHSVLLKIEYIRPDAEHNHFSTPAFVERLKEARAHNGLIVVDPLLMERSHIEAYAMQLGNNQWIIGLSAHPSLLTFEHEWAHIEDMRLYLERYRQSLIANQIEPLAANVGALRRAIRSTATDIEYGLLTEMNATGRELSLMRFGILHKEARKVWRYRSINGSNLGLSRAALDPLNFKHYRDVIMYASTSVLTTGTTYKVSLGIALGLTLRSLLQ